MKNLGQPPADTQKVRDLRTLIPKRGIRDVAIKALLSGLREPCRRGDRESVGARGDRGH